MGSPANRDSIYRGTVAAEMFPSFAAWYLINWGEVSAWEHHYQPILLSGWALTLFINGAFTPLGGIRTAS